MRLIIINVLLLSLITSSLGDGVRLGGRKEWPMVEDIEVEEVGVDTETVVPTFMGSSSFSDEICCSCPDIPEGATEEEICLIMEGMGECNSICEEDGGDGPNRQRNLQYTSAYPGPYRPFPTSPPTPDPCDGPSTKRRLQYSCGHLAIYERDKTPRCEGAVKFINCDLSRVRWIPEDDGNGGNSMPPHPMPGNGIWYHSDGLCFPGYLNFWKIPDHCEVKFECKGKRLDILDDGEFSIKPKVRCVDIVACVSLVSQIIPWPVSVPFPMWHDDYEGNPSWPDCKNATNWVGGGGGGVPSF